MSNDLTAEEYTDKSFVVRGEDTRALKDKLSEVGGKFNANLKGGPGWIFSLKKRAAIEEAMKTWTTPSAADAAAGSVVIHPRPVARQGHHPGSVEERLARLEERLEKMCDDMKNMLGTSRRTVPKGKSFDTVIFEEDSEDGSLPEPRPRLLGGRKVTK